MFLIIWEKTLQGYTRCYPKYHSFYLTDCFLIKLNKSNSVLLHASALNHPP